jgi:hypothetical protein
MEKSMNHEQINNLLHDMALAMAASKYSYSGPALVCLPDGSQVTREDYWNTLDTVTKEGYERAAYAAFRVMERFGLHEVMSAAFENYLDEK